MGTLKAIPRVVAHTAASMVQMPVSGWAALGRLISSKGDIEAANKVLEDNQRVLDEAYLTTPEEAAASENINLAMKPFQMAGEGLKEIVRQTPLKDTIAEPIAGTIGEASAVFGAGGAGRLVKGHIPSDLNAMKPVDTPTLRPVSVPAERMATRGKLVGDPYTPAEKVAHKPAAVESLPGAGERPALPYPDYAGEGFTFKAASDTPDLLRRDGKPFQSEVGAKAAIKREGVTGYEVVEVDGGYVARAVEPKGREFRPEDATKPGEPLQPVAAVERSSVETGNVSRQSEIVQPGVKRTADVALEDADPIFTLMNEAKREGGFNQNALSRIYDKDTVNELMRKRPGIVTKNGPLALDTFAAENGYTDADLFMQQMLGAQTKKQFRQKMAGEVDALTGGNWDLIRRGYEPATSIEAYNLGKGDRIIRNGEVFKVTDDQGGKLTLKDGETLTVPMEESLTVDGFKKNPRFSEETGTMAGMSEAETFGLVNPETEIFRGDISKKDMTPSGDVFADVKVETDAAKRQEIKNSIAEGEMILSSGKSVIGRKMSPEELAAVQKSVDKNKAQLGGLIGSERGSMPLSPDSEVYRGASSLKKTIENLPEMVKGAVGPRGAIRRTAQGFSEALNSPEVVYGRDPKGAEIYKTLDRADQAKNAFLSTEGQSFTKALGRIKADTTEAAKVGQALDGKIKPSELSPAERHLHDFLKERFDFLIHKAARHFAGSEEAYMKTVRLAQETNPRQMKIEELAPDVKAKYDTLTADLQKVRGGKKLDELSPTERADYYEIRQKQRDFLHEEFLKSLPDNERQAYDLLKRQIKNYLPHILDPEILLTDFKQEAARISERLKTATDPGTITKDKQRIRELEEAIIKLQNGQLVTYESLPRNVRFKFFETRKDKAGYSFDAVKAYQAYLNGIARKIFDEPAVRHAADLYGDLDPSLKDYTKWHLRRFMGWDRTKLDPLAGAIASFQWIRTLGFNPRSAITNLTQRLNTVAELPLKYSIIGERMAFTKEGKALFDKTGIAKEVPHVLMEGAGPESLERIRTIAGYMFNKVELGNRKHAFLTAYSYIKDKTPGISESAAIDYATGIVHKTQFRYGRVGMPKIMTSPAGRVGLQFWSYPIKQIELMSEWARHEPLKLIKFLAIAEGTGYTLKEFLDTDLSNAIGIGVNWAEALEAVKDLTDADIRGMFRHSKLAVSGGGGILPSGLGPTASSAIKIADKIQEGKGFEQFRKEVSPVVWRRVSQAYDAAKGNRDDLYPIKNDNGEIMYFLKGRQLIQRTIGPMTATEKEEYLDNRREALLEQERTGVLHEISSAIVDGDQEKVKALVGKYQIVPSDQMIENEALRRVTTRQERRGRVGVKEQYQFQREGRLVRQ